MESISEDIEITYPKEIVQKNQAIEKGYQWFVGNHKNPKIGFPKKRGTEIIYKTVKDFLKNRETTIELVRLIGVGDEIPNLFKEAMEGK